MADTPEELDDDATVTEPDAADSADAGGEHPDVADLSYEAARDELVSIVARLEGGSADLEESMRLWGRGEKLAAHCQQWLDTAEQRLDAAAPPREGADGT